MQRELIQFLRLTWLLMVAAAGLASLVGSGGGAIGFPPCGPPICVNLPPKPSARISPSHATVQVGQGMVFTAITADLSGSLTYRWQRSADRGNTWVDVPGANTASLSVGAMNLADDGLSLRVLATGSNGSATAIAAVLVSATPGIVLGEGEFLGTDWAVADIVGPNPLRPAHTEARMEAGGNPGAWRSLQFTLAAGTGSGYVVYLSPHHYDPAAQGALRVIDHAEDCKSLQASDTLYVQSHLALQQGARTYVANTTPPACNTLAWSTEQGRNSLARNEFRLFDGPACGSTESCPDFSASGAPLRLGLIRFAYGLPGSLIGHGLDNWVVTLWRQ